MRSLSLYLAALASVTWLVLSLGGFYGLTYVGLLSEGVTTPDNTWFRIPLWMLFGCLMLVWWGGPTALVLGGRAVFSWIAELGSPRPLVAAEWIAVFGHLFMAIAGVNAVLFPRIIALEFVYGFLLIAAVLYASGLIAAALTARSKRTPSGGDSPPFGAV